MTEARRSQVVELLEQQRYDEALPILGGLVETDPADRELQIYHLLVVRILILRWNLTGAGAKRAFFLRIKVQRVITSVVSFTRATLKTQVKPLLGRIYQAAGTRIVLGGVKPIVIAGAGLTLFFAILVFHRHGANTVSAPAPATMVTAILGLDSIVSASDAVPYLLNDSRTALEATPRTARLANAHGVELSRIPQLSMELLPTGLLTHSTERKAAIPGAGSAKTMTYLSASGEFAEGRQVKQTSPVKDLKGLTDIANTRDSTPRKILGYYRSRQAIPIRTLPRFAATTVREIDSGVALDVVAFIDSWAEVELKSGGIRGFVRREFLIPLGENRSLVTPSSPSVKAISEVIDSALGSTAE